MGHLLYIEASPRKKQSVSIEVANTFISAYQKNHPDVEIKTINLWNRELPPFDGDILESKYAIIKQQSQTEAQRKAWRAVEDLIKEFKSASAYLFAIPMWNFGIPYKLKHYFDLIVQPNYTFAITPSGGFQGLVTNKPATIIYARGNQYTLESGMQAMDLQKIYMETILKFIGITDIRSIIVEPTITSLNEKETIIKNAKEKAFKLANPN